MVYLSLVTYEIGKFRGKWQANTLTWLSVYIFIVILDFCSFWIANVSYLSQYKVFVVAAAAKQTTCFYEITSVFMFPVQCALASATLDGFCLACISPRIQHNPIMHCSVIAVAWRSTTSSRGSCSHKPSLLWRCCKMAAKMQTHSFNTILGPPEAILISRHFFLLPISVFPAGQLLWSDTHRPLLQLLLAIHSNNQRFICRKSLARAVEVKFW